MKKELILKKVIEKAIDGGWDKKNKAYWMGQVAILLEDDLNQYYNVIFDHSFAKAFWGKKKIKRIADTPAWEFHLIQLVLAKDRLAYLEKFL